MVLCKLLNANVFKKSTSQNKAGAFRESLSINKLQGKDFEEVKFTFYYANTVTFLHALKDLFKLEGISKVTGINAAQLGHYIQGVKKPSASTEKKIREGVMRSLSEMQAIKFR